MAFVSLTRLHVRAWHYLPAFMLHARRVSRQARRSRGFIVGALSGDLPRRTFWTATVWADESAMRADQLTGDHRAVMAKVGRWCDEGSVARIEDAAERVPTSEETFERMREHGRTTRLPHPSPAHAGGATVPDERVPQFASPFKPAQ